MHEPQRQTLNAPGALKLRLATGGSHRPELLATCAGRAMSPRMAKNQSRNACAKWRRLTWGYERARLNVKESSGLSRPDATGALDVRALPKEILRRLFRLPPSP